MSFLSLCIYARYHFSQLGQLCGWFRCVVDAISQRAKQTIPWDTSTARQKLTEIYDPVDDLYMHPRHLDWQPWDPDEPLPQKVMTKDIYLAEYLMYLEQKCQQSNARISTCQVCLACDQLFETSLDVLCERCRVRFRRPHPLPINETSSSSASDETSSSGNVYETESHRQVQFSVFGSTTTDTRTDGPVTTATMTLATTTTTAVAETATATPYQNRSNQLRSPTTNLVLTLPAIKNIKQNYHHRDPSDMNDQPPSKVARTMEFVHRDSSSSQFISTHAVCSPLSHNSLTTTTTATLWNGETSTVQFNAPGKQTEEGAANTSGLPQVTTDAFQILYRFGELCIDPYRAFTSQHDATLSRLDNILEERNQRAQLMTQLYSLLERWSNRSSTTKLALRILIGCIHSDDNLPNVFADSLQSPFQDLLSRLKPSLVCSLGLLYVAFQLEQKQALCDVLEFAIPDYQTTTPDICFWNSLFVMFGYYLQCRD